MRYLGDYAEDEAVYFTFTTVGTSGAPTQLAGTPAISVYKDASTTQSTAGVTLTADFDSVTGLNHVAIDTSADAFYATGADYSVVITTGTVGGTSVVGYTVGTFSIQNRYGLTAAAVNAEVVDVVNVDTLTLPAQGAPTATPTMRYALGLLYKALRNRSTQTADTLTIYADDGTTADHAATVSDDDTTFDRGELGTGA